MMKKSTRGVLASFLVLTSQPLFAQSKTPEERQAEAAERILQRQTVDELRTNARRTRAKFVARAEQTLAQLTELSEELEAHETRMKALLANVHGKRIARDATSLMTFLRIHDEPVASREEVRARRAAAISVVETFESELQGTDVGYLPSERLEQEVDDLSTWSFSRLLRLRAQVSTVNDLLHESRDTVVSDDQKTMQQTIDDFRAQWPRLLAESNIIGREIAKPQAQTILVDGARLATLERAEMERKRTLDENRAEMERQRAEYELEISQMRRELEAMRARDAIAAADANAELEREKKLADAERHAGNIEVDVVANKTVEDAEHQRKLALAKSAEIQELLKPFISKAYYQPGGKAGFEKTGVSLSAMVQRRALEQSDQGLAKLHAIGTDKRDHERPRLGMAQRWRGVTPLHRDQLKEIQGHLIDLGEVLVELGYLAP